MLSRKETKPQKLWLDQDSELELWAGFEDWRNSNRGKTVVSYVQEWIAACAAHPVSIVASDNYGSWNEIDSRIGQVDRFGLRFHMSGAAKISDKFIHTLEIYGPGPFTFVNCTIKNLELRQEQKSNVRLENCKIGILRLMSSSVATLEIIGSSVRRSYAPPPNQASPFTGSVEIRNSKFSPAFQNAQAYRNMRHHLSTLHNHEAASVFHAAEMEAEVGRQSLVDKTISFFYQWLSNYGGSSIRPFAICLALVLINFLLLFVSDGVTALGEAREVDGWHYSLYGFDDTARFLRAAVFSVSQLFNPLGIFGTRLLLTAKTPCLALASALLGLASTISFALFILAVRRRFKLDRS
jgi:hypothetical protein